MITVITGSSHSQLMVYRTSTLETQSFSAVIRYPEQYLGAVDIFKWCEQFVKTYPDVNTAIITLNLDVVSCIDQLGEKHDVDREFILVTEEGVQNCGTKVEPVFKEFNKILTLLENLWEEDKKA